MRKCSLSIRSLQMPHEREFVCWWKQALDVLSQAPELADVAALALERGEGLLASRDLMKSMVRAVCGQQVSNRAALALSSRVLEAAKGCEALLLAQRLASFGEDGLRGLGLSKTKAQALAGLSELYREGTIAPQGAQALSDAELIDVLTSVKGVGPWTAHMILIFGLGRPDVWPVGDYGIKKALACRGLDAACHEKFAPWRTAAAWLLWRSQTQTPVQY